MGVAAIVAVVVLSAPRILLRILTSHLEVIELAEGYRFWFVILLFVGAAAFVYDGYFLGLTAGRTLRNAMLVSLGGVFLPLAYGALVVESPQVLWMAFVGFMVARVVTLGRAARLLDREIPPAPLS